MKELTGASVFVSGTLAGIFEEIERKKKFRLSYLENYSGPPISLALPVRSEPYDFEKFPPFFDGLLPEGSQLEGLLRQKKLDKNDYFGQLVAVGADMVGAITVKGWQP